jgi:hypothetical protein
VFSGLDGPTGEVRILDKTYKVRLEDLGKSFLEAELRPNAHVVSGRVPWKSALRRAFGTDFGRLMVTRNALGAAIGSAAIMFSAMAQAHQDIPARYLSSNSGYSDSSYGRGFVACVVEQFPELGGIGRVMERALGASLNNAKREYEASIASLAASCCCKVCQRGQHGLGADPVDEYDDDHDHDDNDYDRERMLEEETTERLSDGSQLGEKTPWTGIRTAACKLWQRSHS